MKSEYWVIISCGIFFALVAPIYWVLTKDPTGTSALTMTFLLTALLGFYLVIVSKQIPDRPEDNKHAEIADGAGELGFFPPFSWWPLVCGAAFAVCMLGIVFGWWLFIIGIGFGLVAIWGWVFEYYRGIHAH